MKAAALLPLVALALGGACQPDNKVKPGAPELMSLSILEANGTRTDITKDTSDCAPGTAENGGCDPAATACRLNKTICHCVPKAMDDCTIDPDAATTGGNWFCHYGPMASVLATFDRLLDTSTLGPGNEGAQPTNVVMAASMPMPALAFAASANYNPNGSDIGLIFPAFGNPLGPSLLISGDPALPVDSNVTLTIDPLKVRAKDGKTSFTAQGLLQNGILSFDTLSFGASITVPVAPPPMPEPDAGMSTDDGGVDAGISLPDAGELDAGVADAGKMTCPPPPPPPGPAPDPVPVPSADPVTITFTNPVYARAAKTHITITANGTPIPAADIVVGPDTSDPDMNPATTTITIAPMDKKSWPASATIEISVDAATVDVLGAMLGAVVTGSFETTASM